MGIGEIFTDNTALKQYKVTINNVEVPQADVLSCEILQSMFTPCMYGFIEVTDTYAMFNTNIDFTGTATIKIIARDTMDATFEKNFTVVDFKCYTPTPKLTVLVFKFVDTVSYKLHTTYFSKSFKNTSIGYALQTCMDQCGALNLLYSENGTVDFTNSYGIDFVVPNSQCLLDFFMYECRLNNTLFWSDIKGVHIKQFNVQQAQTQINKETNQEIEYTDNTMNNNYLFKIHEYRKTGNSKENTVLQRPSQISYRISGKDVTNITYNLDNLYQSLLLNNTTYDPGQLQDTNGYQMTIDYNPIGAQQYDIFKTYICANQLICCLKGNFGYTFIGDKAKVKIAARTPFAKEQYKGDIQASGYYLITEILYKFVNGRFLMRPTFSRFDNPKVVN